MNNEKLKVGDWVEVPEAKGHGWKVNQGQVTLIKPPYCMVRVSWHGRSYNVPYKTSDVKKL